MRIKTSQVEPGGNSSVQSQQWQTSGIANASQALSGTEGISFWVGESSTGVGGIEYYLEKLEVAVLVNARKRLKKDSGLRESIERAREEMRKGGPYLAVDEVFGS